MGLSFANPTALWGLLGLPLILWLHFLQSRNRQEEISTLFLLELLPEETKSGAVFQYLRTGLQLWMQLLSVLLLTLLLSRPMWLKPDSVQSVAVVLDATVSMQAFQEEWTAALEELTERLTRSAGSTEWWLELSDPARPALARGVDARELLEALPDFQPWSGPHSPRLSLERARQLVGPEGLVIFLTDHVPPELPLGVIPLSVGRPLENTGFTGIEISETEWEATLIHLGPQPVDRTLRIQFDDGVPQEQRLTLEPGSLHTLRGPLPESFVRGKLELPADAYPADNVLPFVPTVRKSLTYALNFPEPESKEWVQKLMQTLPGARVGSPAFLSWNEGLPPNETPAAPAEVWFLPGEPAGSYQTPVPDAEGIAAELRWDGFLGLPGKGFELRPGDRVELWMGEEPLVIRRRFPSGTRLLLNFRETRSNAARFPALLLMLHRFVQEQQDRIPARTQLPLETRQQLPGLPPDTASLTFQHEDLGGTLSSGTLQQRLAPERPGYFQVMREEEVLLRAGVFVGDVAEGNFQNARPLPLPGSVVLQQRTRNSETDFLRPLWFILLSLALILGWWSENRSGG
ncbi:MAG: BatA domain-containing protein [Kiritimatiellia bacterium]